MLTCKQKGPSLKSSGGGTVLITASTKGRKSVPGVSKSTEAVPARPLVNKMGKLICSSLAPKSMSKSYTSSTTARGRASERSILLTASHARQTQSERFTHDETRLRQGAFGGIHEQQDAVDHTQGAFHLAAEVGMAGGVHELQGDVPKAHRGGLGENGDASLALLVVGVHHAVGHDLAFAVHAALPKQGVYEGGFAMVNVRDDRDVAEIFPLFHLCLFLNFPARFWRRLNCCHVRWRQRHPWWLHACAWVGAPSPTNKPS